MAALTNEEFVQQNKLGEEVLTPAVLVLLRDKDNLPDQPAVIKRLAEYFQGLAGGAAAPAGAAAGAVQFPNIEGMSEDAGVQALEAFQKEVPAAVEEAKKRLRKANYKGRKLPLPPNTEYTLEEMWAEEFGSPFRKNRWYDSYNGCYKCYWANGIEDPDFDADIVDATFKKIPKIKDDDQQDVWDVAKGIRMVGITRDQQRSIAKDEAPVGLGRI